MKHNTKTEFSVEELIAQEDFENSKIKINTHVLAKAHEVKIMCGFGDEHWADELATELQNATQNDYFVFHVSSPGGDAAGLVHLLTALKNTEARTHAVIEGLGVASAASFLVLHCDSLEIRSEYAQMMIHGLQLGISTQTTSSNLNGYAKKSHDLSKQLVQELIGFLTQEEIDKIESGLDFYLDADEIQERFNKWKPNLDVDEIADFIDNNSLADETPQNEDVAD